jgi:cytochrome c-type biogenesis protein CcmH
MIARPLLFFLALTVLLPMAATGAVALAPEERMKDPALETRARALYKRLRCVVCQNQSIDDSDATIAADLRALVRERLRAGDSDTQVIAYVRARYGNFILLRPPVEPLTWLLWFGPVLILLAAGGAILLRTRRRAAPEPAAPLSKAERERLDGLLGREDGG